MDCRTKGKRDRDGRQHAARCRGRGGGARAEPAAALTAARSTGWRSAVAAAPSASIRAGTMPARCSASSVACTPDARDDGDPDMQPVALGVAFGDGACPEDFAGLEWGQAVHVVADDALQVVFGGDRHDGFAFQEKSGAIRSMAAPADWRAGVGSCRAMRGSARLWRPSGVSPPRPSRESWR